MIMMREGMIETGMNLQETVLKVETGTTNIDTVMRRNPAPRVKVTPINVIIMMMSGNQVVPPHPQETINTQHPNSALRQQEICARGTIRIRRPSRVRQTITLTTNKSLPHQLLITKVIIILKILLTLITIEP
jgi:hypothetical protein